MMTRWFAVGGRVALALVLTVPTILALALGESESWIDLPVIPAREG